MTNDDPGQRSSMTNVMSIDWMINGPYSENGQFASGHYELEFGFFTRLLNKQILSIY